MKSSNIPWIAIILLPLYSISFEYNTDTSKLSYDGLLIGMLFLGITSIVMTFKITDAIQNVLINRDLMRGKIRSRYEFLLPLVIIIPAIGYTSISDKTVASMNDSVVHSWIFKWGQHENHIWIILAFLLAIFLHRILLIIKSIESNHG